MYRKILVPLDLSRDHRAVFEAAAELVEPKQGCLALLHVVELIEGLPDAETESFYASLRERGERKLARWSKDFEKRGIRFTTAVMLGKRGSTITRYAVEQQCDMIIVTSRPADPDRPGWGFGTTSHQVALMAPCSVLLVR